jgi:hypothetical protein
MRKNFVLIMMIMLNMILIAVTVYAAEPPQPPQRPGGKEMAGMMPGFNAMPQLLHQFNNINTRFDDTGKRIADMNRQIMELKEGQKNMEAKMNNMLYIVSSGFIIIIGALIYFNKRK